MRVPAAFLWLQLTGQLLAHTQEEKEESSDDEDDVNSQTWREATNIYLHAKMHK